jgi:hypothetical protein
VLHHRRRCAGPSKAPVLVCVGVGTAAAGVPVLSGAWYGFAVPPRRTSSGHAVHICATGAVATCAVLSLRAGVRWARLAWRFGSSGRLQAA